MPDPSLLSTVALLVDLPEKGLRRGEVGTIVESLSPGVFEVDFGDDSGKSYASVAVNADNLLTLLHGPSARAA